MLEASPEGIKVPFLLADTLSVEYCIYHHPDPTNDEVISEVEETVRRAGAGDPWLSIHQPVFEWKLKWPPYTTPAQHELVPALIAAHSDVVGGFGVSTSPVQEGFFGVCDLTWMHARGIKGLVYGPGLGRTAHAEDEYVRIDQLVTAAKAYALTAIEFCGLAKWRRRASSAGGNR